VSRPTQIHNRPGGVRRQTDTSAAGFAAALMERGALLSARNLAVVEGIAEQAFRSMVHGSVLTGAPPLPVDTGELRDSYQLTKLGPATYAITSDAAHALAIEYNWGGVQYRSGGPHGRALTHAALPKVADVVASAVVHGDAI
jgi:hypothetical protein